MATIRVKQVKKTFSPGDQLLVTQHAGKVGMDCDSRLAANGHNHNPGKGVDLPDLGVEHKARKMGSKSHHVQAKMSADDIIGTPWDKSVARDKSLVQHRTIWDPNTCQVVDSRTFDFGDTETQKELGEDYESAREILSGGVDDNTTYIRGGKNLHLDRVRGTDMWQVKINDNAMRRMEARALGKQVLEDKDVFEW